jgi:hypothetical protein
VDPRPGTTDISTRFSDRPFSTVFSPPLTADETLLPPLYHQLAVARHALAVLVGETPADWSPPDFELGEIKLPHELPVSLPSELVHRRPDILAAEAQLHAATAAVGIATANLYPQITLTASGGQQALPASAWQLFDRSGTAWSLISGLTAPIFDGGTLRAERRAAIDELHASAERYQQTVLESFGQVADVLGALTQDARDLAAQSRAQAVAQTSLELSRECYGAGNTGILQVLDAQRQNQQAQLGFVRAQAQQYLDTISSSSPSAASHYETLRNKGAHCAQRPDHSGWTRVTAERATRLRSRYLQHCSDFNATPAVLPSAHVVVADYDSGLRLLESARVGSPRVMILTHSDSEAKILPRAATRCTRLPSPRLQS